MIQAALQPMSQNSRHIQRYFAAAIVTWDAPVCFGAWRWQFFRDFAVFNHQLCKVCITHSLLDRESHVLLSQAPTKGTCFLVLRLRDQQFWLFACPTFNVGISKRLMAAAAKQLIHKDSTRVCAPSTTCKLAFTAFPHLACGHKEAQCRYDWCLGGAITWWLLCMHCVCAYTMLCSNVKYILLTFIMRLMENTCCLYVCLVECIAKCLYVVTYKQQQFTDLLVSATLTKCVSV